MVDVHVPDFNEVLANLVLSWERKQPMLLKGVLEMNEKLGDVIPDHVRCKLELDRLMKKSVNREEDDVPRETPPKCVRTRRRHPYGRVESA